jgi:DNA polymerase III epsilon subunit family exonuclease
LLDAPADQVPVAALDLETTGLKSSGDRVVEAAVVRLDPGGILRQRSFLINPGHPIPKPSIDVHGITDGMVDGAPSFIAVLPRLTPLIEGAVLIAHNAPFDIGFIEAECSRHGLTPPVPMAVVDTLQLARKVFKQPRCGLGSLAERIGLPLPGAHRALADARAALVLYQTMIRQAEPGRIPSTRELLDSVASSEDIRGALVDAHSTDQRVIIDYASYKAQGELSVLRTITIRSLSAQKVTAYCHLRQDERTFRIDRIRRVVKTEEAVTAPPNHPS